MILYENIPQLETKGTLVGHYKSAGDLRQTAFFNVSLAEVVSYREKLIQSGYALYSENTIKENCFSTYINADTEIHLMFYPALSAFRIAYSPLGYLPAVQKPVVGVDYEKKCESTVTQPAREGALNICAGECYVIQAEDGSFMVIDGGCSYNSDEDALLKYLQERNLTDHEKPQVTWMITHAHSDHICLLLNFLTRYGDQIDLNLLCYNFPDFNGDAVVYDLGETNFARLNEIVEEKYPKASAWVFHSGQKMYLPGYEVEILFTQEDWWPNEFSNENYTSAAWKMTFNSGYSFLVLGDCEKGECDQMAQLYGDYLQSDMMQCSHHGLNCGTMALYQAVDPKICFWPIDEFRYLNDGRCLGLKAKTNDEYYSYTVYEDPENKIRNPKYDFNYWIRTEEPMWHRTSESGRRLHFHNSVTVTVDMNTLTVIEG